MGIEECWHAQVSTRRSSLPDATPRSLPGAERMAKLSAQIVRIFFYQVMVHDVSLGQHHDSLDWKDGRSVHQSLGWKDGRALGQHHHVLDWEDGRSATIA